MKNDILIIGKGIVGTNLGNEIEKLKPDYVDKFKPELTTKRDIKYKVGFVCVDTPIIENYVLDTREVENAIVENDCEIYVIKSTCPVGTNEMLVEKLNKRILFSPEYYGATPHCNNYNFDFTILGGKKEDCLEVIQLLQKCYDGRHKFKITDGKTAETVKFMENSWIATKVTFCNEFNRYAEKKGISYEELRELFLLDERVSPSHTFVFKDQPYFNSHCLNKDVPYIAFVGDIEILKDVCNINNKYKK